MRVHLVEPQTITGAILGGAIGDVLGGIAERCSLSISDDTQLTLATCESIIDSGDVTAEAIAARMLVWFRTGRVSGIGSSTLKAMRDLDGGVHWALAGAKGERAAGNGAAMRIAPVAFLLDPAVPSERTTIRDIARITHHHEEAYVGALAVVLAIRRAAKGEIPSPRSLAAQLPDSRVRDYLIRAGSHDNWTLADVAREIGTSGFTPETIAVAMTLVREMMHYGIEAAIRELNELGGDTDTIGSIAGQMAGTLLGADNLPLHVLSSVPDVETITRVAEDFGAVVHRRLTTR